MRRTAFLAGVSIAGTLALFGGAGPAVAGTFGDAAILPGDGFRLNPALLEPGAFAADSPHAFIGGGGAPGTVIAEHVDVTQVGASYHVTVKDGANFSIDQVLIPGRGGGYRVYNTFDTGSNAADPDIDPGQTATDLGGPAEPAGLPEMDAAMFRSQVIVAVSDHPDADQNEPYVQAAGNEVAAVNRPVITPFVSALGVSALENMNTYKIGFGYKVERWYDPYWLTAFNTDRDLLFWHGDPQAFDTDHDHLFDHVFVKTRAEQPGVRRYNDIDEFGEQFADPHGDRADYGQPVVFNVKGDPYAYLHKTLPGILEGDGVQAVYDEAALDATSVAGLLSFTAQGDLPISWALKPSLAPASYGRKVTFSADDMKAWEDAWQAYYEGKGAKPSLPLAPGTNSPTPKPGVIVNVPEKAIVVNVGTTPTVVQQGVQTQGTHGRMVTIKLSKKIAKDGRVTYLSAKGLKKVKAHKSGKRLIAKVDLRGLPAAQAKWAVLVTGKSKAGRKVAYTVVVTL